MALTETLDRQDMTPTVDQAASYPLPAPPRLAGLADAVATGLTVLLTVLFVMVQLVGSYTGIVYWAVQGSLGGVLLSAFVPGFGAASLLPVIL
ncbi:hypothetical protein FHG66_21315 [Rubellimicrobium rubrum]|uniref:Uncharacterized protein n=1 Tax=Rubellimicrobium rubrum TaxID=2585369 RepID=A0A5C4MFI6_9RHOB|nr:hypothetical protein [Rubellimicrobium rubrum]TNC42741.1 hypothetical protein FHG66_21315 [Rubellimicrobium rubrum]